MGRGSGSSPTFQGKSPLKGFPAPPLCLDLSRKLGRRGQKRRLGHRQEEATLPHSLEALSCIPNMLAGTDGSCNPPRLGEAEMEI